MTVVVVIDFAHSGTTMLTGVLEHLGVPMVNEHFHQRKREDWEVIGAIREGEEAFAAIVAQREAQHQVWGFKHPGAWKFWPMLDKYLINPVYLAIYKDIVSVTRRRFGKSNARWLKKVRNTAKQQLESVNGLYTNRVPVTMFSYQRAILNPSQFVCQVIEVVGINPMPEQVLAATKYIQPNTKGPRAPYPKVGL